MGIVHDYQRASVRWLQVNIENETVLVDLAIDGEPRGEAVMTVLGPTVPALEVAARKVLALFDPAEARDYVDVYRLSQKFDVAELVHRAMEKDVQFDATATSGRLDCDLTAQGAGKRQETVCRSKIDFDGSRKPSQLQSPTSAHPIWTQP